MKRQNTRRNLTLNRDVVRMLSGDDLGRAIGGGDSGVTCTGRLQFSNPVVSCDSCTNCACKPPGAA